MDTNTKNINFVQNFTDHFSNSVLSNSSPKWLSDLKENSFKSFQANGLPNQKVEEWKYAKLAFLNNYQFEITNKSEITEELVNSFLFQDVSANVLVFLNGKYIEKYSKIIDNGIEFSNLNNDFKNDNSNIKEKFGKSLDICNDAFLSLNTAFANDGANIKIQKGKTIEHTIHIVQIFDGSSAQTACFPRNIISAAENSQANIIETYHKIGEHTSFSSAVTEIYAEQNATLDFYRVQILPESHIFIGKSFVSQDRDSVFNDVTLSLDGKFIRNNIYAKHFGSNAETHFFGFYFATQNNFIDNHTFMDHSVANCNSNEVYKGIIGDSATAVFNGKILVRPDAQKTNAYQSNKNVLLSDNATINTKPELEIYADDVKCSHGATSGSLDKDHLFYLRARGLDPDTARGLLLSAFGEEIIDKIKNEQIREQLSVIFENKLSGKMK